MDNEIKPLLYCYQPPHPQISMLSLTCALGLGRQKNQTLNTRETRQILFNLEIRGLGFYFVYIGGFDFFVHLLYVIL